MKTTRFFLFKLLFASILVWLPQSLAQNVNIPDANLRAVMAETRLANALPVVCISIHSPQGISQRHGRC